MNLSVLLPLIEKQALPLVEKEAEAYFAANPQVIQQIVAQVVPVLVNFAMQQLQVELQKLASAPATK